MIKIITVGKIKETYLKEGINDYLTRINKYHKVSLIEVIDSDIISEKKEIMSHLKARDYIITLEIEGKKLDSLSLARKIDELFITNSNIVFIIGGSTGLHNDIKTISNYKLSFSDFTFPHGLFRLILLEQLYRSFKILNNETYHK